MKHCGEKLQHKEHSHFYEMKKRLLLALLTQSYMERILFT